MSDDPAELIFYGEMTTDRFFEEAERVGATLEDLRDENTHNHVFYSCLVNIRTETANAVAAKLGIPITEDQACSIARNSLVPEVVTEPAPLKPEEREIATELYFHAIKAAAARHGEHMKDRTAQVEAKRMVAIGEKGLTRIQKLSRACGCLVVVGMFALGSALACLSAALVMIATAPSS